MGVYSQTGIFIKGQILDSHYNTPLPYVALFFEGTSQGDITNSGGRFKIKTTEEVIKNRKLKIMYTGYKTQELKLNIDIPEPLTVLLTSIDNEEEIPPMIIMRKIAEHSKSPLPHYLYKLTKMVIDDNMPLGNKNYNKFDLYNIQEIPAYNHLESVRLRLSVASNSRLHDQLFTKLSFGYGFKDHKLKHRNELTWSFNKKAYHEDEFPRNNLRLIHEYDIFSPGENNIRSRNDFLLLSYRRSRGAMTYRRFTELNYEKETLSGLSYLLWGRASNITSPSNSFSYINTDNDLQYLASLNSKEIGLSLRYLHNEAYIQKKRHRKIITETEPLFFLSHTFGQADLPVRKQLYNKTEFSYQQRFGLDSYGAIDIVAEYQKTWNRAPYPLLLFPNTTNRFFIDNKAFFLIRAFEFIHDEQYSLKATYIADELLLSKVNLFNKLGLKELFIVRGFLGKLNSKNIASSDNGLLALPTSTISMNNIPYIEGVVGLTNILGVLRVEYVHRFTYRHQPNAIKYSFRVDLAL